MKTVESKNASGTFMRSGTPFFSKESDRHFFGSSSVQAKLNIGQLNDPYEKEADSTADKVVQRLAEPAAKQNNPYSQGAFTPFVQKKCDSCEQEEKLQKKEAEDLSGSEKKLQRKPIFESNAESPDDQKNMLRKCAECEKDEKMQKKTDDTASENVAPEIESNLNSSKGSGHALAENTRQQLESSMGADFSNVRIHDDPNAARMSKGLNAQAFTHGNDIYFNSGKYDTGSTSGRHLLAHELTHTVQQDKSRILTYSLLRTPLNIQKVGGGDDQDIKDLDNPAISGLGETKEGFVKKNAGKIEVHFKDFVAKQYASPFLTKDAKGNEYISSPPFLKPTRERKTKQGYVWRTNALPLVTASLNSLVNEKKVKGPLFQLKVHNSKRIAITGSIEQIAKEVVVPFWGLDGKPVKHQIEHKVDWQIAGGNHDVDVISNLILLDDKENIRIGQVILNSMKKYYSKILSFYKEKKIQGLAEDFDAAKGLYDIYSDNLVSDPDNVKGSLISISNMDPGKTLNPVSGKLVDIMDEDIPPGSFSLKTSMKGGGNIVPYNLDNEFIEIKGDAKNHKLISVTLKNVVKDDKGVLDKNNPDKSLTFRTDGLGPGGDLSHPYPLHRPCRCPTTSAPAGSAASCRSPPSPSSPPRGTSTQACGTRRSSPASAC